MNPAYDPLLDWYRQSKRDLPWRLAEPNPYATWVSEIMLQQTGVSTVIPYFNRWMERFPTVQALAGAKEADVLSLWQGLGYYRRARNLLAGAQFVASRNPISKEDWLTLPLSEIPGVGRYTAGAIASIAFDHPEPLVDGNVERVFARLTGERKPKPTKEAWLWATSELRHKAPGDWNQALMELGATICTPRNPNCSACPLLHACIAHQKGIVSEIPTPAVKPAPILVEFHVRVIVHQGKVGLTQRPSGEWWHGLWTSPLSKEKPSEETEPFGSLKTVVTNHKVTFILHRQEFNSATNLTFFGPDQWKSLPVPTWQRRLLEQIENDLLLARA